VGITGLTLPCTFLTGEIFFLGAAFLIDGPPAVASERDTTVYIFSVQSVILAGFPIPDPDTQISTALSHSPTRSRMRQFSSQQAGVAPPPVSLFSSPHFNGPLAMQITLFSLFLYSLPTFHTSLPFRPVFSVTPLPPSPVSAYPTSTASGQREPSAHSQQHNEASLWTVLNESAVTNVSGAQ